MELDLIKIQAEMLGRLVKPSFVLYVNPYEMDTKTARSVVGIAVILDRALNQNTQYDYSNISMEVSLFCVWATKGFGSGKLDYLWRPYVKGLFDKNQDFITKERNKNHVTVGDAKKRIAFLKSSALRYGSDEERREAREEIADLEERLTRA